MKFFAVIIGFKPFHYVSKSSSLVNPPRSLTLFLKYCGSYLYDKVLPYIKRDISQIEPGDVLIGDGHKLSFQIINPYTGQPNRAVMLAYQDWKSTALVGFEIMLEENTQCIASALRNAIINLGKVPKYVYQDNGKAFKSKYFIENGIMGLFTNLGINKCFNLSFKIEVSMFCIKINC